MEIDVLLKIALVLGATLAGLFIVRVIVAWMFRIDEIIKELKEINQKLG